MSKFIKKLQNLSRTSTSPMGFQPSVRKAEGAAMLFVAGLSGEDIKEAKMVIDVKADAGLILSQDFDSKLVKQAVKALGDVPMGVFVKDAGEEKVAEIAGLGCDFAVFDNDAAITALHNEGISKFLIIEHSLDQGLVRAINNLDVDGVFINRGEESFITVKHLLVYQRFVELLEKPVIVILPSLITSAGLSNLWQAGIDGIVSPPAQPVEALIELRKMIDELPRRAKRRRGKVGVILPHYGIAADVEEDEEDEEEEEI